MKEHIFLQNGHIEEADLTEILALSAVGELEWGRAGGDAAAVGTNVGYSISPEYAQRHNLVEVRAGYMPSSDNAFNYLRLRDFRSNNHYVEHDTDDPLKPLAGRVLRVAMIAVATRDGRLSGTIEHCDGCGQDTGHLRLHDAPYGLAGATMGGSGRTECVTCGGTESIV